LLQGNNASEPCNRHTSKGFMNYQLRSWKDIYRELKDAPDYKIEIEDYSQLTAEEFINQTKPQRHKINLVQILLDDLNNQEEENADI
jgi:hypothetical protein